jgi:hypothetical protein
MVLGICHDRPFSLLFIRWTSHVARRRELWRTLYKNDGICRTLLYSRLQNRLHLFCTHESFTAPH